MRKDKSVFQTGKNRYFSFMFKKANLFHISSYYISHLIFSMEIVNDYITQKIIMISIYILFLTSLHKSLIKRLNSKRFLILSLLRRQDSFFCETIFQTVVIYLDKSTKMCLIIHLKFYPILELGCRIPERSQWGQSSSILPFPSSSKFPQTIFCICGRKSI